MVIEANRFRHENDSCKLGSTEGRNESFSSISCAELLRLNFDFKELPVAAEAGIVVEWAPELATAEHSEQNDSLESIASLLMSIRELHGCVDSQLKRLERIEAIDLEKVKLF